jgi:hypothetical protein
VNRGVTCLLAAFAILAASCGSSDTAGGGGASQGSGIEGAVNVGPTCPGPSIVNGTRDCTEPLAADLRVVTDSTGQEAAQTSSDSEGHFRVDLPPGSYAITVPGNAGLADPVQVTVQPGKYSEADVLIDSGVR